MKSNLRRVPGISGGGAVGLIGALRTWGLCALCVGMMALGCSTGRRTPSASVPGAGKPQQAVETQDARALARLEAWRGELTNNLPGRSIEAAQGRESATLVRRINQLMIQDGVQRLVGLTNVNLARMPLSDAEINNLGGQFDLDEQTGRMTLKTGSGDRTEFLLRHVRLVSTMEMVSTINIVPLQLQSKSVDYRVCLGFIGGLRDALVRVTRKSGETWEDGLALRVTDQNTAGQIVAYLRLLVSRYAEAPGGG